MALELLRQSYPSTSIFGIAFMQNAALRFETIQAKIKRALTETTASLDQYQENRVLYPIYPHPLAQIQSQN